MIQLCQSQRTFFLPNNRCAYTFATQCILVNILWIGNYITATTLSIINKIIPVSIALLM